jgi:hypothetical protein
MRLPPWQQSCDKSRRQAILHLSENSPKLNKVLPPTVGIPEAQPKNARFLSSLTQRQKKGRERPKAPSPESSVRLPAPATLSPKVDH